MDDQATKTREMLDELRLLNGNLLWSVTDLELKNSIELGALGNRLDRDLTQIQLSIVNSENILLSLSNSVSMYGDLVHRDLTAVSGKMIIAADTIKDSVRNEEESIEATIARNERIRSVNPDVNATLERLTQAIEDSIPEEPKTRQATPVAEMRQESIVPRELDKNLTILCDSAADFFKAWSNPVNVGVALAVPLVAGLGVITVPLYMIVSKVADSIVSLAGTASEFMTNFSLKKFVFGGPSSTTQRGPDNDAMISAITSGLLSVSTAVELVGRTDSDILTSIRTIQAKVDGFSLKPLQDALSDMMTQLENQRSSIDLTAPKAAGFVPASTNIVDRDETEFRENVLNLLSSTIKVRIVEPKPAQAEERAGDRVDAFSAAVRPLVDGQIALNNMLQSNLRKLTEAVVALRETPAPNDKTRNTTVIDTVNTELSSESSEFILQETKRISGILETISSEFRQFKSDWTMRKPSAGQTRVDMSETDGN